MKNVDWRIAQRVGEVVAGTPEGSDGVSLPSMPLTDLTREITGYTGLTLRREPPPLELVDRPRWIAANLRSMRPLLDPMTERVGGSLGPLSGLAKSASGFLVGIQVGALAGALSQRVLGQYDLSLLDGDAPPRLLLLSPNLAQTARTLRVDGEELVSWVSIHELTHAVQFGSAPWLREHLGGILQELIASLQVTIAEQAGGRLADLADLAKMRGEVSELVTRARRGELLQVTLGRERWELVERMQATMTLIEGHAEHVMDAVGVELLPSLPRLRAALTRRRQSRPLPWRIVERLLGLELKMRQYEVGKRFCDEVVAEAGPHALSVAWRSAADLPTQTELEHPRLWLERAAATP
ncbi:MAG: zinc-dependent metalloprotease [Solirubrobacteraceae bacterium]